MLIKNNTFQMEIFINRCNCWLYSCNTNYHKWGIKQFQNIHGSKNRIKKLICSKILLISYFNFLILFLATIVQICK